MPIFTQASAMASTIFLACPHVTRYLENQGIDPALLSAAAFGEHQPVADNETPEGRAKNRRIAIILQPME